MTLLRYCEICASTELNTGFRCIRCGYDNSPAKWFNRSASVDRSPQGGNRETGCHAKHESAAPKEDAQ